MGIEQSKNEFRNANVKLYVTDTSQENALALLKAEDPEVLQGALVVANKSDITHSNWKPEGYDTVSISCLTGEGIDNLLARIKSRLHTEEDSSDYVILEERNAYHIRKIIESLTSALNMIHDDAYAEIYIKDIDSALAEAGMITGTIHTEEILGRIFSKFCVGK